MHHHIDRTVHTMVFVTLIMELWLEREIAQWVLHDGLIRRPIKPLRLRETPGIISLYFINNIIDKCF